MRLIIHDGKKVSSYKLPDKIQDFYIVDYKSSDNSISEMVTLEGVDGKWNLVSNKNVTISLNNDTYDKAPLELYRSYIVYFSISNIALKVMCIPDTEQFKFILFNSNEKITIGQDGNSTISCRLPSFLINYAIIEKIEGQFYIYPANEKCIIYVNEKCINNNKCLIKYGDEIFIEGLKIIWMDTFCAVNDLKDLIALNNANYASVNFEDAKKYSETTETEKNVKMYQENDYFYHTPKIKSYIQPEEFSLSNPPDEDHSNKVPLIISISSSAIIGLTSCFTSISAIIGLMNGTVEKDTAYLEIGMGLLMLASCFILPIVADSWQRKQEKKRNKQKEDRYIEYFNKVKGEIDDTIRKQENILKEKYLTFDELVAEIKSNGYNLWSKEIIDRDFLNVSLGIGNIPAFIKIKAQLDDYSIYDEKLKEMVKKYVLEEKLLNNVPMTISMAQNRITPIVIQNKKTKDYINGIMAQLLFYYSPLDLKIVVLSSEETNGNFDYLKYANHCWTSTHDMRFYASNDKDANQLSMYLEQIYSKRLEMSGGESGSDKNNNELYKSFKEYYLIVTDDYFKFKNLSIINKIINSNENVGFSLLVFSENMKNLPSRLEKFIVIENGQSGIYNKIVDNDSVSKFNAEYFDKYDINNCSFKIANIPVSNDDDELSIPKSINFLELYNVGKIEQLNILSKWKDNLPYVSLNAPIGVQSNNRQIGLDLHEKAHGPHGLIAGSTGSGKSEFIITYILSMAVTYHPYEVQFVLIDYKGGGLAGAFEKREKNIRIPHLVGTITNLDKSEMNRTLVSIKSELERRQIKFNEARDSLGESTIDIYKYQRLYREGKVSEPISHLFIISDEFAELKQQQPDFMDELVSTARIGRSLGVHLILATQKPAGVVNDQIWSNSRFKVCLKVQTSEDSFEVLKRDDASKIVETGRFYLQVGNDELFELGQSAWAGDKYVPSDYVLPKINDSIDFIATDGSLVKSVNDDYKKSGTDYGEQISNVVKYLYDIAVSNNIKFNNLWLPKLPEDLYVNDIIKKYDYKATPYNIDLIIGEYDKPANQEQGIYKLPLNSNTVIFGCAGSGKENLLSTMIYSSCILHTPKEINYYVIDFGSEALSVYNKLPHLGSYINSDSIDKVYSLFAFLDLQIKKRKGLFAEYQGSYKTYCEKSGNTVPLLFLIINSYEGFREYCEAYDDMLVHLLREGSKYGILVTLSVSSTSSVRSTTLEYFNNKILLQMQDPFDYQYVLGAPNGMVPATAFGRGITLIEGCPCEFQTAFICEQDKINDYIKELSKQLMDYYKFKVSDIKTMPRSATFDNLKSSVKILDNMLVGYNLETADLYNYNFVQNKKTLLLGNNVTNNDFTFTLIDLIDNMKNIKMNIFDISSCINTDGNASYYNANFLEPFNEVLSYNGDVMQVNVILGIGFAKNLLLPEEYELLYKMLANAEQIPNNTFIIVENYELFMGLKDTEIFSTFDKKNGLWYGDDIESQEFFEIDKLLDSDIENKTIEKLFVIQNSNYVLVRAIGYKGDLL